MGLSENAGPAGGLGQSYRLEDCLHGRDVFLTGTQALVRLALEQARLDRRAGRNTAGYITGYRGSPLAGYDSALAAAAHLLTTNGIVFSPAVNEDLAATALIGTQEVASDPLRTKEGVFGIWYGKGPGVDRAGDALKHGNGFGASSLGGVLALLGDDHGCVSSSMPHQSDQAMVGLMMPLLHPACVADFLPYGLFGIAASRFSGAWIGMKTISEVVESGATLTVGEPPEFLRPADTSLSPSALNFDPARNFGAAIESRMLARLEAFLAFARSNPLDRAAFGAPTPRHAVIAVGKAHFDVVAALERLGLTDETASEADVGVFKVGLAWPVELSGFKAFLQRAETVLVVEEKRSFVEAQLRVALFGEMARPTVLGKRDASGRSLLPDEGELTPSLVAEAIARAFEPTRSVTPTCTEGSAAQADRPLLTRRTPFFCPGCPHNLSTRLPENSFAFPGIGCHFMASWMQRRTSGLVQMGGEGANWIGQSPFTTRAHMFQNLGDGTYFHSGLLAIRAAIAAKVTITYKILYNHSVAMTGGQPLDGTLRVEDLVAQLRAEGVTRIAVVSASPRALRKSLRSLPNVTLDGRDGLMKVQEELRSREGVTAIVYDQACAADERRKRKRAPGSDRATRVFINTAVCEGCGDCSAKANCISIVPQQTTWGVKRRIDQSACNKDLSCLEGFCPSFVTITGRERHARGDKALLQSMLLRESGLPSPNVPATGDILVGGIGGTGVLTVGAVLSMAAHLDGKGSTVLDFTGFAQKGGAVISHVKVRDYREQRGPVRLDNARADVMIACDLVVATGADALKACCSDRTVVVCNKNVSPTGDFVIRGLSDLEAEKRIELLRCASKRLFAVDACHAAEGLFGDSVFANMLLVGHAWQHGLLPLSRASIEMSIRLNGRSVARNIEAFAVGRMIAHDPDLLGDFDIQATDGRDEAGDIALDRLVRQRTAFLTVYQNAAYARCFSTFVAQVQKIEHACVPTSETLSRVVALNLSRLMAYKDEYEVARLHLDPTSSPARQLWFQPGAKTHYHLSIPAFSLARRRFPRRRKMAVPGYLAIPLFKMLCAMRPLRGTLWDLFGRIGHREDRRLIADYRQLVERLLGSLSTETLDEAVEIANLVDGVRGYGHVREAAAMRYRATLKEMWPGRERRRSPVVQDA